MLRFSSLSQILARDHSRTVVAVTMKSATLVSLGFLGVKLHAVSSFHVPVPVQAGVARNMRSSSSATALSATEGTSESLSCMPSVHMPAGTM